MAVAILFFLRVMRVLAVQSRPVDYEKKVRRRRHNVLALEFLEPSDRSGERIAIETGVTIGRSPDCDLSLQDTYLSTRHARLANDEGDLSIEDLGSTNGTYVNQELVKGRVRLERGDVVQVGGVLFEVVR
jgi:predicted component of type VI protein secretion system